MYNIKVIHVSLEIWGCIFCLIMALCSLFLSEHLEKAKKKLLIHMQVAAAVLLGMDALAWMFRGYPGQLGFYMVRISNFCVFLIMDVLTLIYHAYVCDCVFAQDHGKTEKEIRKPIRVQLVYWIGICSIIMVILSQFTHFYYDFDAGNFYHRNAGYIVSILLPMSEMVLDCSLLIQYRRQLKRQLLLSLFAYIFLPVLSMIVMMFYYGISLINIAVTISVIHMFVAAIIEQSQEITRREKETYDLRIQLLISQISPHFIYNTLTTIKHLCKTDPRLAAETVDEFTVYIRGHLDSLTRKENIPFLKELNHVQNYLAIEQKRFGERVKVKYEITETDFMIPPLTLQPIVENAVRHGLMKKEEGGMITISSGKYEMGYEIRITDDGVGFDSTKPKQDGKTHTGVKNVRSRIEIMCKGTMEIQGVPGKGTTVRIRIPYDIKG